MTNKEIIQANLLDIIFENRNKDYGAYALRRDYNHRLLIAMGAASSVILLFILINVLGKKEGSVIPDSNKKNDMVITTVEFHNDKPKEPEKPKQISKPVEKVAKIKSASKIEIVPDKTKIKDPVPFNDDIKNKAISDVNTIGKPYTGIVEPNDKLVTNPGTGNIVVSTQPEDFKPNERDPEFPGGPEALKRFLGNNLNTPGELESSEKKMVQIRFKVDKDGVVSSLEIVRSGGNEFDREVIRVCKKMPRWKPAIQNGVNVAVSYLLPVTFIRVEQ